MDPLQLQQEQLQQQQLQQQQFQQQQEQQQQEQDQQQDNLAVAIGRLFPEFDAYCKRQTELNTIQIEQLRVQHSDRDARQQKQFDDSVRAWVAEESVHVTSCDGGSVKSVREWIRAIRGASVRAPANGTQYYVRRLLTKTCRGDLFEEVERYLCSVGDRDLCTWEEILEHVLAAFLGPDESEALKDELKRVKQGPREEIPAYNRRFLRAADVAYPTPTNADRANIATIYMVNLRPGKIQDRLFDHEPRLVNVQQAADAAYSEWARVRFRERCLQETRSVAPEPMEIDSLTAREQISQQEREIKRLRSQLEATQRVSPMKQKPVSGPPPKASYRPNSSRNSALPKEVKSDTCRFCLQKGHWVRDCPRNKVYWEKKGGERRPLPENERSLDF